MAKRRTSGIQRRQRASGEALDRRLESPRSGILDWRVLLIAGLLVVGSVILVAFLVVGSPPNPNAGQQFPNSGQSHLQTCVEARLTDPAAYSSTPATSGPHCGQAAQWGAYSTPQLESQLVHNLEHGGIVIWYEPDQLDAAEVAELEGFVERQVASGPSGRYKYIVSPWSGPDFGSPIAVTSWTWLLHLDEPDTGAIRDFADAHYGRAPEPNAP